MAEQFRAVNKAVSSWDGKALAELVPALETLAEHAAAMTDTFMRLPEQYQDNLISVADLIFVGRSMERHGGRPAKGGGGSPLCGVLTAHA